MVPVPIYILDLILYIQRLDDLDALQLADSAQSPVVLPAPIDSPVDFGVPGQHGPSAAGSRAPCAAGAAPHRRFPLRAASQMSPRPRPGQQRRCSPRRQSGWPFTVWANCWQLWCRHRWKIPFFGAATNKSTPIFEVLTISHHAFLLATSEAPAPFSFLFVCRNESEIVSSTSLHLFHRPEGLAPNWLPGCCNCETSQGLVDLQGFGQSLQLREWQEDNCLN